MTSLHDVHPLTSFEKEPWDSHLELLFKEAKRRERRRRTRKMLVSLSAVAIIAGAMVLGVSTAGPSPVLTNASSSVLAYNDFKVMTCSGTAVVRPRNLTISCADANTALTSTQWSSWGPKGATGTTTFALDLCTPYCAASPITYFRHSSVVLSSPVMSRHGTYFSRLTVRYLIGSTRKTFEFSWQGDVTR